MKSGINYSLWKEEHQAYLETLSGKTIFLLFSGGKDSSITLDFTLRAAKEFRFDFETHAGAYPLHRYTDPDKEKINHYWNNRGIDILWHDPGETDDYIQAEENPCLPCQKLRKRMLKNILISSIDDWKNLVLITSYTLWDIVSYSMEHMLGGVFSNSSNPGQGIGIEQTKRFRETAQRFYPLIRMKEGYSIFRPLIKFNGNDILELIAQENIPILSVPCKFKNFRPKRILEKYYETMGIRFDYDKVFDFARKSLDLPDITSYTSIAKEEYLDRIF